MAGTRKARVPMMEWHHNGDWINALGHLSNKSQFILEAGE